MTAHAQRQLRDWFPIGSSIVGLIFVMGTAYGGYLSFSATASKAMNDASSVNDKFNHLVQSPDGIIPNMQKDISNLTIQFNYMQSDIKDIKELLKRK